MGKNSFDILDFNNQTGIASNHIILQAPDMEYTYGAEFSPSGKYLYGTRMNPPSKLFQFDLSAGSQVAILNSRTTLDSNLNSYYYSALQIAPDFKIYAAHRDNNTLGVIDQPDSAALNCSYIDNAVYFSGNICASGLPNFVPDYVFPITATIPTANLQSSDTIFCEKQSINFFDLSTNNPTSWQWYFTGAQPNSSTLQNPNGIYYPNYGQFDVSLKVCNVGGCDSLFFPNFIAELQSPPAPIVTVNGSIMCSSPAYSYAWYETSSLSTILSTTQCFQPLIPGDYFVIIADSNGCSTPSATVIITSIKEHETNPCKLWLSGTKLNLQSNCITDPESFLQVYDAQGKEVFKSQLSSSSVDLPLTNSGIYFYRLVSRGLESQGKFSFLK
ncbi:MAG: T9SS type A sorting domain-containing protein [Bacteroidetes bacterium]|nr:T9SS type A sorting domain-containing protein [Bacteroidota bacterium]